ncbi:epidermal retinal dehydrogenase 2 [Geopyxis carbonaria]|nr:epidermal retinal dehydrogenase 2 [Geopyxis carbonaria]
MAPPFIPREGLLTLDGLVVLLKHTLFSPTITLPLLAALKLTPFGRDLLSTYPALQNLQYLAALGCAGRLNRLLSWGAQNNWTRATFRPSSEIVVVTGGSSGIGAELVKELIAAPTGPLKAIVVLDLQPLPAEFADVANVHYVHVNLADTESINAACADIKARIGDPTVLVNNAGVCIGAPLLSATSNPGLVFAINAVAHYTLIQQFLPAMVAANHGHIVTVASVGALVQAAQMVDYNASKAAAYSFHEGLRLELRHRYDARRVRTTLVSVSHVKTPLFEGYSPGPRSAAFTMPSLEPKTVAEAIAGQIWRAESAQIVLPRLFNVMGGVRGWPHWMQEAVRGRTRENMRGFRGKQVMAKEE